MHRRFLPLIAAAVVLVGTGFAAGQSAVGIMAAIRNCQNPNVAPGNRVDWCSQAIHTNLLTPPILAAVYNDRGVAYEAAHDIDHARQDYDKALELKPDFAQAQANRARLLGQQPVNAAPARPEMK